MAWSSWSTCDWNRQLTNTVFFDKERLDTPINRISVSDRILLSCSGDNAADPVAVRKAFIASFGKTAHEIRSHFSWSISLFQKTASQGFPPTFAALYLSLLAASADEQTYNEGNFRRRFAEIVKPVVIADSYSFSDLPKLWQHIAGWSQARAKKDHDCRVLQLPDPQRENIIGYSKRLAFPNYRDETTLSKVLAQTGMDGSTGFSLVAHAVSTQLRSFSASFLEEFQIFRSLSLRGKQKEAYESPFWGAVRDISWERGRIEADSIGIFQLGIDIVNPYQPEIYLLTDKVGSRLLARQCRIDSTITGGLLEFIAYPMTGRTWSPEQLLSISSQNQRLNRSKLWKGLAAGCIAFFRDQYGNMTTDGEHIDGSAVCFLAEARLASSIGHDARHYGWKFRSQSDGAPIGKWKALIFDNVSSKALLALAKTLPESIQSQFGLAWHPPRPRPSGGAWYGQALLLNPASNPVLRMRDADSGTYELFSNTGKSLVNAPLEPVDSDGFQVPPAELAFVDDVTQIRYSLSNHKEGHTGWLTVPVVADVLLHAPPPLRNIDTWLSDGPAGTLSSLQYTFRKHTQALPIYQRGSSSPLPSPPKIVQAASDKQAAITTAKLVRLDELPKFLSWQCDALSLRFQRRNTLPFAELKAHTSGAAMATGIPVWQANKLLTASCWLDRVQQHASPQPVFSAAPRTIALLSADGPPIARIVGMIPRSEWFRLRKAMTPGESVHMLHVESKPCIGAIELRLSSPDRLKDIATDFQCLELTQEGSSGPLASLSAFPSPEKLDIKGIPRQSELNIWRRKEYAWSPFDRESPLAQGDIIRQQGSSRPRYFVHDKALWIKTDSVLWAFLFSLSAREIPIGTIMANGDCQFHPFVRGLPSSMTRWWLHWGGGCMSVREDGGLTFTGDDGHAFWEAMPKWIISRPFNKSLPSGENTATERRKLALRLRLMAKK